MFNPSREAIAAARTATRRARERALTAVPTPSQIRRSPLMSQYARTIDPVPRGGRRSEVVPAHGTRARYNSRRYPCRDKCCREANARYMARYRGTDEDRAPAPAGRAVARPAVRQLPLRVG